MDLASILPDIGDPDSPIGFGGCRAVGPCTFESCAYDLVVFDGDTSGMNDTILVCDHDIIMVRHASLLESDSGMLLQFDKMRVLQDDTWDLRSLLRWIDSKRDALYRDLARNSLLQSMFYCQRAVGSDNDTGGSSALTGVADGDDGTDYSNSVNPNYKDAARHLGSDTIANKHNHINNRTDPPNSSRSKDAVGIRAAGLDTYAYCWQKCASFFLADALCALNCKRPSPSHMLDVLRNLPKERSNDHISVVIDTLGLERATPTLLGRMAPSTIGFVNSILCSTNPSNDHHTKPRRDGTVTLYDVIMKKHDYFLSESLASDCYFYLGYINKLYMSASSHTLHKRPDLIHLLKVGLDTDADPFLLRRHANMIQESCNTLLHMASGH